MPTSLEVSDDMLNCTGRNECHGLVEPKDENGCPNFYDQQLTRRFQSRGNSWKG